MSDYLRNLIPESNRLDLAFARASRRRHNGSRENLMAQVYEEGSFVGAFKDDGGQAWPARAARYMRDDFLSNTPGTKKFFSDIDSLLTANGDGERHINCRHALELWEAGGKKSVKPYSCDQGYGSCVDASASEHMTTIFGWRAARPEHGEVFIHPAAWYWYADRGYCSDGWGGNGIAAVARRRGCAFRTVYRIGDNTVDFTDDDENENIVARKWCRSGIPDWLSSHTQANHPFKDGAITAFNGDRNSIKKAMAAGGILHHSGVRTSGGPVPFTPGRTGPHMQSGVGYDDTDEYRQWLRDKHNLTLADNDFAIVNHQTWGSNWRGECGDQYWPTELWGPKPEGAWVCKASWLLPDIDYVWMPWVEGFKGTPVPNIEPIPPLSGSLYAEQAGQITAIRGELQDHDGHRYIAVPSQTRPGEYVMIPKPRI